MSRIFVSYHEDRVAVDAVLETRADFDRLIAALQANATLFYPAPPPNPKPGKLGDVPMPTDSTEPRDSPVRENNR